MTILDLLDSLSIAYRTEGHHHCRKGWSQVDCPQCSPFSGKFRLGINLRWHNANCWSCGPLWLNSVLARISGKSVQEITRLLRGISKGSKTLQNWKRERGELKIPQGLIELTEAHKRYLEGRGFDPEELIETWGLKAFGQCGKYSWRIWIPIHRNHRIVSWTTRSIGKSSLRYLSAPATDEELSRNDLIYGEDYCTSTIIVVEGPTDVWRVGPGAGATLGLSYSEAQICRLGRYPVRVICFDRSSDAQHKAKKLCMDLSSFPGRTYRITLDADDPGSASAEEIQQLREEFLGE